MAEESKQGSDAVASSQRERAGRVIENLAELEPELRAAAIVGPDGETIASTGVDQAWSKAAISLLDSVDAVRDTAADSAHVATETGEVFLVREGDLALVAVTARFVLASLTSYDMRMALRDLASGGEHA